MTQPILREAVETTWEDVQRWVHQLVWDFYADHGGDLDEIRSAAFLGYVRSFHSYDPAKGEFTTWVAKKVRGAMRDHLRDVIRRQKKKVVTDAELDRFEEEEKERFDKERLLERLSEESKMVVGLVFETPIDVKFILAERGGESRQNWRAAIREFLRDMGWTAVQIKSSFKEIREAL